MVQRTKLQQFLDSTLAVSSPLNISHVDPHMTNGLMVKGKEDVQTIGFGVSASLALFEKAAKARCDAIIVHHAFNFPPHNRFDAIFQGRMAFLLAHNISLFGYHFLLDAHSEIGHNAQILHTLGAIQKEQYLHRGNPWGWIGIYEKPVSLLFVRERLAPYMSTRAVIYDFGPKEIRKIAAVSGKGAPFPSDMQYLLDHHIDCFITGEVHEWNRELFKEAKIHFLAGGHYNTEVFGLKALMKKVQEMFPNVTCVWLDHENDV